MSKASTPEPPLSEPMTTATGGKPYTAPPRQIWGWGTGKAAEFGLAAMFGQAMIIFSVGFGLNPVIVSWCMMPPRLMDGIVDPIIGHWSDGTHTRWGWRKPFMVVGAAVGAFFLSILWWVSPNWSHTTQFLFLGLVGMFLYLCYGTYTMAWNAIGYELSGDYHERSKIQAVAGLFAAVMILLNNWPYRLALRPIFGGVVHGRRWIGAGAAANSDLRAKATIEEISLTNRGTGQNLLAASNGAKVSAVEPPHGITRMLYWLVIIPSIVFTVLTSLMTIRFPLTVQTMIEVRRKLRRNPHHKSGSRSSYR
jgi:MFS/sugar transport protein